MNTVKEPEVGAGKHYHHINQAERDRIQDMLDHEVCPAEIARVLGGRQTSTITREIERNRRRRGEVPVSNKERYLATAAGHKAYAKRLYSKHKGEKIEEDGKLRRYLVRALKRKWSPDEISGFMKLHLPCAGLPESHCGKRYCSGGLYASKNVIYRWLYGPRGQRYTKYLCTKRFKPKKRKPQIERVMIPNRVGIEKRPKRINNRSEYGHHEADTIVSSKRSGGKAALATDCERKSRYVSIRKIPNLKPDEFASAMRSIRNSFERVKSETMDNGIENRYYEQLGVKTYFCDPYSSWQKGGVENANRLIRRFIPKGSDIGDYSPQRIAYIQRTINEKPRKILGYKSALQVAEEEGILKQK